MKKFAASALVVLLLACGDSPTQVPPVEGTAAVPDVVLPPGLGLLKFDEDRGGTCTTLSFCIGVPVPAPGYYTGYPVVVPTGEWVTLYWAWEFYQLAAVPTVDQVIEWARYYTVLYGNEALLDGTTLPMNDSWVPGTFRTFEQYGMPAARIAGRFYLKPQRKGDYVYTSRSRFYTYSRIIRYVPDEG